MSKPKAGSPAPDTAELLDQVDEFVRRYVVLQGDHFYDAVALWVLHAHAIRAFETSPRLLIKSPEKESGKTRLEEILEALSPNPLFVMNTTIAAIFRLLAAEQITLLLDEADAIFSIKAAAQHEDLRALLNAGYRRGATVARVVGEGKKMTVKRFEVFAATALAAIGDLPDTIQSRSIIVPMRRRAPDEHVEQFRRRAVEEEAVELRQALVAWATFNIDQLTEAHPAMPEGVTDRAADCWEALLAIADLAEGDWPKRARDAAQEVVAGRVAEDTSLGVRLLVDVRAVLAGVERISSADLAGRLNALEESTWGAWHDGKGMTQRDLAARLKSYGITPSNVRLSDGSVPKGYQREQFADAFARYLRESYTSATSATDRYTGSGSKEGFVASVAHVAEEEGRDLQQGLPFGPPGTATAATAATTISGRSGRSANGWHSPDGYAEALMAEPDPEDEPGSETDQADWVDEDDLLPARVTR